MKKIISLAVIFILLPKTLFAAAVKPSLDAQIAAEEKKRNELTHQIQNYRKEIRQMGAQVNSLLTKINTLQQDESYAGQELTLLELQNQKIQQDIEILEEHIKNEQIKINGLTEQMRGRVLDMYKYGASENMRMLFASRSVFEAVENAHLLKLMTRQDEYIMARLQISLQNMDLSYITMDEQQERLKAKAEEIKSQREKYNQSINETNAFLNSIRRKKELAESAAKEAEQAQKAAGKMIADLQKKKTAEREKYLAGKKSNALFEWPIRGTISSPYGERMHPILKRNILHSGIDIVGANGTPVKAPAGGDVIYDGWLRGYGRVVVLDHGRGYSTLYAHLSASLVHDGQSVKQGEVIARVGKTGNTTGYHLHFEVRKFGTPDNPMKYLKR